MRRLNELPARVRALDQRWIDGFVTLLFAAGSIPSAIRHNHHWSGRLLTLAGLGLLLAAIYLRRHPRVVLFSAPTAPLLLIGCYKLGARLDLVDAAFFILLVLYYSLGSHQAGRRLLAGGIAAFVTMGAATDSVPPGLKPGDIFWLVALTVAPMLLGRAVRERRTLAAAISERAERAERENAEEARRATEAERSRIAGELHDVVAHSVSAMTVQAGAARRMARRDPARAEEALRAAEETGRAALTEMRRMLGVLRRDDDGAALAPQPGMGRAAALAAEFRNDGLAVEFAEAGARPVLTPGLDLAAYRILEDSLRSAVRHAARTAAVEVRYGAGEIEMRILDDGVDNLPPGMTDADEDAAIGVKERVALYGGRVQTGRRPDGRFGARIFLPTEAVAV